jgi:hypothetical protein
VVIGGLACLLLIGCSAARRPVPLVPAASEGAPIAEPSLSPSRVDPDRYFVPEDAVVRLVGPQMTCTGTLVDEDLVLTAVHCLVVRGPHGEFTRDLVSVKDLRVELGGDFLPWGHVGVASIVPPLSPEDGKVCGERGGHDDVAILVLPRKLVGVGVMPPREGPPVMYESLNPIGFGRCALSAEGIRRQQRVGGTVAGVTAETFEMRAAICPGDSGGPVHARGSPQVVGIVSLSAMGADDQTKNMSVMVRVDAYRGLFDRARHIADGVPSSELPPVACAH